MEWCGLGAMALEGPQCECEVSGLWGVEEDDSKSNSEAVQEV